MSMTDYFFPRVYVPVPEQRPFFNPASWMGIQLKKLDEIEQSSYLVSQTRLVALDLLLLADRLFVGFPKTIGKISLVCLNGIGLACLPYKPTQIYKALLDVLLAARRGEIKELFFSTLKVINAVSDSILMLGACTASTLSLFAFSANAWQIYSLVNPYAAFSVVLWGIGYFRDLSLKVQLDKDLTDFSIDIALRNIALSLMNEKDLNEKDTDVSNSARKIYQQIDCIPEPEQFFDKMETEAKALVHLLSELNKKQELLKKWAFIQRKQEECEAIIGRITTIKYQSDPSKYILNWPKVAEIFSKFYENPLINIEKTREGQLAARTIYQLSDWDIISLRQKYHSSNQELNEKYPKQEDRFTPEYFQERHAFLKEIYASTVIKISSTLTFMAMDLTIRMAASVGLIVRKFFPLTAIETSIDTFFALLYWGRYYAEYQDKKSKKDNVASVMS